MALPVGLWRGSAVTLVRDWPSFGVYFAVYEGMQEVLSPGSRQSHVIHPLALLMAGEYTLNPQLHPLALMACKHAHNDKCSLITHAVPLADTLICRSDVGLFRPYIYIRASTVVYLRHRRLQPMPKHCMGFAIKLQTVWYAVTCSECMYRWLSWSDCMVECLPTRCHQIQNTGQQ